MGKRKETIYYKTESLGSLSLMLSKFKTHIFNRCIDAFILRQQRIAYSVLHFTEGKETGVSMGMGILWESDGELPMGWGSTHLYFP